MAKDEHDERQDAAAQSHEEDAIEGSHPENAAPDTAATQSDEPDASAPNEEGASTGASRAKLVAVGILSSRLMGFVRERATAYFFGAGEHADVFRVALRAPNLLQNLLGEGTMSAAFIPVYSRMLQDGRPDAAGRFAGAIFGLLLAVVAVLVIGGILLAEQITTILQPGWTGDAAKVAAGEIGVNRFDLAVRSIQITFPMTGALVLSAWALGVLNSHRRFLLPYSAPVLWNAAIIGALIFASIQVFDDPLGIGRLDVIPITTLNSLLFAGLTGALVGGVLQFAVQLPLVFRLMRGFRFSLSTRVEGVKQALRAFVPVLAGRGVYQISGYLDLLLAGFVAAGSIAALSYAQTLYMLPVSLFGMSVAASELPELSRLASQGPSAMVARLKRSWSQVLYPVVAATVAYIGFGFVAVSLLYRTGAFGLGETWLVTMVLAAYSLGLIATTSSRLLQNTFYALDDTKTPAKIAVARVVLSLAVGAGLMFWLDTFTLSEVVGVPAEGRPLRLGAVGLALGASAGAWLELFVLVRKLKARLPEVGFPMGRFFKMMGLAAGAAAPAAAFWLFFPTGLLPVWLFSGLVLAIFGVLYLALGRAMGFEEGEAWLGRLLKKRKR